MNQEANTLPFTEIGRVDRSHGLKGEIKILFDFEDPELLNDLTLVYLQNDRGDFFPVRISETRIEEKRNEFLFFVQFENIADRTAAEALKGKAVFLESEKALPFIAEQTVEQSVLNYDVYDENDDHIGIVMDILENPAQSVLNISSEKGTLMVPFVDHYVTGVNEEEELLFCQNLKELEDLL